MLLGDPSWNRSIAMLCGVLAVSAAAAVPAIANPEVVLEWIFKDGEPIDPDSTIVVSAEEIEDEIELVLRINLVLDEVAIHEFGFLVIFDDDLRDELDFVPGKEPEAPTSYLFFNPISSIFFDGLESDDTFGGEIGPYRGCVSGSVCDLKEEFDGIPISNFVIEIDQVSFLATPMATNDRRDIQIFEIGFNEEFRDAEGEIIDHADIIFGSASIIPEPNASMLTATAITTLAVLARNRSGSVA